MKKIFILATLTCTVLFAACHKKAMTASADTTSNTSSAATGTNQENSTATSVSTKTTGQTAPAMKNVIVDPQADMNTTGAPYKVDSIRVEGDVLSVFVNYSGGCKEHSFELLSNGMYAKSLPPQINVCLKHTANDDHCRMLLMQELKFNIAALHYKGNSATVVKLGDKQVTFPAAH